MKTNILALITIATAILLTSCEKEIEFNGEQSDPKLVINSLMEPEQRVEAYISKSYFFLDMPNTAAPSDLVASLYVNDQLIGEMTPFFDTVWEMYGLPDYRLIPGYYNDYQPKEGDVVKITATANSFDEAGGATSPLPKAVDCQMDYEVTDWSGGYVREYDYETGEYGDTLYYSVTGYIDLTLTITDPNPGKTDCFRLIEGRHISLSDDQNRYYISFDYDDPVFGASSFTENDFFDASDLDTRPEGVFTDMLFDGSSYRLKVKVYFSCDIDEEDEEFDPDYFRALFVLEHLSKEYYNYLNTCNQGDVALQIYAEPIQTYSNVTNGFGIVGGRSVNKMWLPLPIEEP